MFRKLKRRKMEKTDYVQRLGLLKSGKPRLVVRKSINGIKSQIVEYSPSGDKVLVSAVSGELRSYGWLGGFNLSSSYLTGFLMGKKASEKGIKEAVLDIGVQLSTKGNRLYAFAKGCVDAGLKVPVSSEIMPGQERISGKHIESFAKALKEKDSNLYGKRFSSYLKKGLKPEEMSNHFESVKSSIAKGLKKAD